ncbi:MAG: NAD(P)H-dependent glycerol-3-phosphate dehydrogenase [Clostridiales bacterium]|nr:NAD(P)H-dependent glycerol-3-phosphate dehydrogenase [Clostridiales bacterium]
MHIAVIGCGRWGSFIAWYLHDLGHSVTLYGRNSSSKMQAFEQTRTNGLVTLSQEIKLSTEMGEAVDSADVVVISIASQGLRSLLETKKEQLQGKSLILCMKGLEINTGKRLTEVVGETLGEQTPVAVWLGPGHVQEFVNRVPNCMVIDSADEAFKRELVNAFSGDLIRFYYGQDLLGNEVGAAAKNVVGIAAGLLDGLGLGTLKGALMSRGTREMSRLIKAMGGNELSVYGLCHLGDYEATVFSPYSHNRKFGECFAMGTPYQELAEGYYTVEALLKLSETYQVELPISQAIHDVLYEHTNLNETLDRLFRRTLKDEM